MACCNSHDSHLAKRQAELLNKRGAQYWQCCQCHEGWFSTKLIDSCPTCLTYRCGNCEYSAS
ncbi:hypothetical protein EDB81DRAFT_940593 [Dactylonectria macrodidyma]|uniref:Uncharacterized protein n=1 Tax=Dactylonectria macrodidyma TaxID=307937 RepID=A0A9P9JJI2_9HYPO|nr:hypothetical protein EDB81DRAFT_940593 [Dactylonectria macrodidyma]